MAIFASRPFGPAAAHRLELFGHVGAAHPAFNGVRPLDDGDLAEVARLDTATFGCHRLALLARLLERSRGFACATESHGRIRGFLLGRNGRTATHIGLVVAEDEHTAAALVDSAGRRVGASIIVDAPDEHEVFARRLEQYGFVRERPLMRMILNPDHVSGQPRQMFAIAGPELA